MFLSGSHDRTIRLWDLRRPNCVAVLQFVGQPVANFDPHGLVFATGIDSQTIKLYDMRYLDNKPFSSFIIPRDSDDMISGQTNNSYWSSLKFSPDGKYI